MLKRYSWLILLGLIVAILSAVVVWKQRFLRVAPSTETSLSPDQETLVHTVSIPSEWLTKQLPEETPFISLRHPADARFVEQDDAWQVQDASGSGVVSLWLAQDTTQMGERMEALSSIPSEEIWTRQLGDGFWVVAQRLDSEAPVEWVEAVLLSITRL